MDTVSYVYILTNKNNRVLYTGVTSDLEARMHDHKTFKNPASFTSRYRISKLVFYEEFDSIADAIDAMKSECPYRRAIPKN